jgi:carbonic anhydrase
VVKALLEPEQAAGMPALQSWMRHSLASRERLLREHRHAPTEEKMRRLTEYNVLTQLENLETHPAVAAALSRGELALRGWVYDIAAGSISAADARSGRFELLGHGTPE